ncbi:uncharacterized protein FIBRA_03778 [Fibroporia radiculosa]|uniref:Uncharacterized protein n=1 Tax=Fibroporia radiculosa TaxID=599839 RepID=J4G6B2_9APHY|nr:uncharacterized protein FIBRA_03778 [Fibroporia radiculosa]CCM01713.1 predicted protein [Fibroporia radiculosa]
MVLLTDQLSDIQSPEFLAPPTPSASLLDSSSLLARSSARTKKHERSRSLGLIDAARVRLSQDVSSLARLPPGSHNQHRTCLTRVAVLSHLALLQFRALICSTNKLQRIDSLSSVQFEDREDTSFVYPEYTTNQNVQFADLDTEPMEPHTDERHGRGLGRKIVEFLSRSRSRSKKRRSRSLDAAVGHVPMPSDSASVAMYARRSSLEADVQDIQATSRSYSRSARVPSRPLSSSAAASNSTARPLPRKPHKLRPSSPPRPAAPACPLDIRTEVVILEQPVADSSKKGRKMNIFGLSITSPRKASFGESKKPKSRPPTPGSQPSEKDGERGLWGGRFRSNSGPTVHKSQDGSKHVIKGDILWENSRPKLPNVATSHSRPLPVHVMKDHNTHGEYANFETDPDAEISALGGRCSPLCGLGPSHISATSLAKGKERGYIRGTRNKSEDRGNALNTKAKERQTNQERSANSRRVGSPIIREQGRDSRTLIAASPMEKVASGSGANHHSHGRNATPHSGMPTPLIPQGKRTKHGSFDFERPVSAGASGQTSFKPIRNLNGVEVGTSTGESGLQRSYSARGSANRRVHVLEGSEDSESRRVASVPITIQERTKPVLDANPDKVSLARRTTGSSSATSNHPRTQPTLHLRAPLTKLPNGSETDPGSPISSTHSGNSSGLTSSWGRSAGKRMGRPAHPAFKFEPAVPPIPGSPASDERKRSIASGGSSSPSPLSGSKQARLAGKGRSLELGIGLSWAPSKMREGAMLRTVGGAKASATSSSRTRSRWRGPLADEDSKLGVASDVAEAFREVLGDAAYATFKTYVHRYDAHAIPLDGPHGLIHHVQRLLDSAPGLESDSRRKRALLDTFIHVVRENR